MGELPPRRRGSTLRCRVTLPSPRKNPAQTTRRRTRAYNPKQESFILALWRERPEVSNVAPAMA